MRPLTIKSTLTQQHISELYASNNTYCQLITLCGRAYLTTVSQTEIRLGLCGRLRRIHSILTTDVDICLLTIPGDQRQSAVHQFRRTASHSQVQLLQCRVARQRVNHFSASSLAMYTHTHTHTQNNTSCLIIQCDYRR